jgi:hypothetical protein
MADVLQTPPRPKEGLGCCLGKGCLILVVFLAFLATVFVVGGFLGLRTFTSNEPRELPQVATSEEKQQAVLQRWDNFENAVHERRAASPSSAASQSQSQTTTPNQPQSNPTIEMTADDINQIISSNRHARGHAFVSIENGVGHVAVSIPISKKTGFSGRYLNADFDVRSAPSGDLNGIDVSVKSQRGVQVPGRLLSMLLGTRSLRSWTDGYISQYRSDYDVSSFKIVDDKVLLEAGRER